MLVIVETVYKHEKVYDNYVSVLIKVNIYFVKSTCAFFINYKAANFVELGNSSDNNKDHNEIECF